MSKTEGLIGYETLIEHHKLHHDIENELHKQLEAAKEFHPRAWKLMQKQKQFVVVAEDEPYYLEVYATIRKHELEIKRWSSQDEIIYQAEIERIEKEGTR